MEISLNKKHIFILISAFIIIGLLYTGAYFIYLSPTKQRISQIENSVDLLEKQITILSSSTQTEATTNSYELQKRMPVKPLLDQFVLDLEKAEVVSNSNIQAIEVAEDSELLASEKEQIAAQSVVETDLEDTGNQENEQETADQEAPDEMKKLTILLTVSSDSYYDLKKFIETIEQQTRITNVEKLIFTGPPEITQVNQIIETIDYQIQLSAYYYPTLTDLENEAPSIDTPPPSKKHNPLFPYIKEENDEQS